MSQPTTPPSSGDNARIFTGIRDIPIWAGESSSGNQLPFGPYRWPELVVIGVIVGPTLLWIRNHPQSPHLLAVAGIAALATVVLVVALRILLPKVRPDLPTRAQFFVNAAIPRPVATAQRSRPASRQSPRTGRSRRSSSRRHRGSR
jgi:hypothetical protein